MVQLESRRRSIVKALTWRIFATFVTMSVVYVFTRELVLSAGIGLADTTIKIFFYYSHERLWERIQFGRKKVKEDYTI
ncbi:MAG: DUF2061 domain-containing protein [Chloroflexi bacterium]|nr:DUF2061 domain-containing protein [Chloroflexota bacterium]